jgi:hypothetical protein
MTSSPDPEHVHADAAAADGVRRVHAAAMRRAIALPDAAGLFIQLTGEARPPRR